MDQSAIPQPAQPRVTGIPRLSRLPVPKSSASSPIVPKASSENLRIRPTPTPAPSTLRGSKSQHFKVPSRLSTAHNRPTTTSRPDTASAASRRTDAAGKYSQFGARPTSNHSNATTTIDSSSLRSGSSASSRIDTMVGEDELPQSSAANKTGNRKPRLSLAERTIESIAKVPPSPANGRRRSSFFQQQSPSINSRPTSSIGSRSRAGSQDEVPPIPYPLPSRPTLAGRGIVSAATPQPSRSVSATQRPKAPAVPGKIPSPTKTTRNPVIESKTVAPRSSKTSRPALAGLFNPPNSQGEEPGVIKRPSTLGVRKPTDQSKSPKAAAAANSSIALREQIRAARAAKKSLGAEPQIPAASKNLKATGFDASYYNDPFIQQPKDGISAIQTKVNSARADGRLNISCMGLKQIPEEVLKIYDSEFNKSSPIAWNEVVDLVKFVAADNELESIPESVFPDIDINAFDQDGSVDNPQFGGIELLDLHGNLLFDVPIGLRRLERLTSLNLSRNRLMNDSLDMIAQMKSLRELRMSDNALTGELSSHLCNLSELEVLEVQGNKLCDLPKELSSLTHLRLLNVSNNQLTSLPMAALSKLPIVSLNASKNHIGGALFSELNSTMTRLVNLDISANWLTSLSKGPVGLPKLQEINFSFNRITELPSITSWESLISLQAEDNKLSVLPEGFTDIPTLQCVDFTGNDFSKLDPKIGTMEKLHTFRIAANPIRERKFLTMSTEDLKRDMKARLGLDEPGTELD